MTEAAANTDPDLSELLGDDIVPRCEAVKAQVVQMPGMTVVLGSDECGAPARWIGRFTCSHGDEQQQFFCGDCHDYLVASDDTIAWEAL